MGFDDYISNLIDCPIEIFNYLVVNYKIHRIPVAYKENGVDEHAAMQHFNLFFVGKYDFIFWNDVFPHVL